VIFVIKFGILPTIQSETRNLKNNNNNNNNYNYNYNYYYYYYYSYSYSYSNYYNYNYNYNYNYLQKNKTHQKKSRNIKRIIKQKQNTILKLSKNI